MDSEPRLTAAALIHHLVRDLLHQSHFEYTEFPELIDLAVLGTGLGILQSGFGFVHQGGSFWDSTYWFASPRPFLDSHALAYASAVTAWVRDDRNPAWANQLPGEIRRPMQKSLKYLFKTRDSFFCQPSSSGKPPARSQDEWLQMASESPVSSQIIAIRHLEFDDRLQQQQEALLLETLRASSRPVVLHLISAAEALKLDSDSVASELRLLVEERDDEVRSKALVALTKLGQLDEPSLEQAAKMMDNSVKYVVFAGVLALSSRDSVSDDVLRIAKRGFLRALQTCDYEFVSLFTEAFSRWLDDPRSWIEGMLQEEHPEYLEIAREALQNVQEQSVA